MFDKIWDGRLHETARFKKLEEKVWHSACPDHGVFKIGLTIEDFRGLNINVPVFCCPECNLWCLLIEEDEAEKYENISILGHTRAT